MIKIMEKIYIYILNNYYKYRLECFQCFSILVQYQVYLSEKDFFIFLKDIILQI